MNTPEHSDKIPVIQLKNLYKTFSTSDADVDALKNVNLRIEKGDIFGIIGMSGAGKSTLVRCMNYLEEPSQGSVYFQGQDMATFSKKQLREARQSMGMIFQQFNLLMQRTAEANITFPLEIAGFSKADAKARAQELLKLVGLQEKANAYPSQLSGGQKQRVAIARALATNPQVLLCDEATSALDPATTQSILSLLKEINEKFGITIVIITHEMGVIEDICTHVAIMDQSQIAESGEVKEVFHNPRTTASRMLVYSMGVPAYVE